MSKCAKKKHKNLERDCIQYITTRAMLHLYMLPTIPFLVITFAHDTDSRKKIKRRARRKTKNRSNKLRQREG